jgi:hypothetical protein
MFFVSSLSQTDWSSKCTKECNFKSIIEAPFIATRGCYFWSIAPVGSACFSSEEKCGEQAKEDHPFIWYETLSGSEKLDHGAYPESNVSVMRRTWRPSMRPSLLRERSPMSMHNTVNSLYFKIVGCLFDGAVVKLRASHPNGAMSQIISGVS